MKIERGKNIFGRPESSSTLYNNDFGRSQSYIPGSTVNAESTIMWQSGGKF